MTPSEIVPVILAGGEGRRLRPLTSPKRPKPFLKIFPPHSLLQQTALRVSSFRPPVVVCHKNFGKMAQHHLEGINITPRLIILEPEGRSTAAAIALAAFALYSAVAKTEPETASPLMLVTPSDHFISDTDVFVRTVQQADARIRDDEIILWGVRPHGKQTRYGYIETDEEETDEEDFGLYRVNKFIEKPAPPEARALLKKRVFWNTGIFMIRAAHYLDLLEKLEPALYSDVHKAYDLSSAHGLFLDPEYAAYLKTPPIPVDYAIMEKAVCARLISLETQWSDTGCWPSLVGTKLRLKR